MTRPLRTILSNTPVPTGRRITTPTAMRTALSPTPSRTPPCAWQRTARPSWTPMAIRARCAPPPPVPRSQSPATMHVSEEWTLARLCRLSSCLAIQVGGHVDSSGYYFTASHMFGVRNACSFSCDYCPDSNDNCVDSPTFEDYPFQYTCADWGEDYNSDGNADCAVADAITDPAMCLAADGSTLMDADGYPCEVRPPSPRPPLTIPGHHARVRGMDPRTSLSPLIMSRNTGWRPRGQLWLLLHRKPHGRGPPQLPRHLLVRLRVSAIAQARSSDLDISVSVLATLRAPYEPNAERSFTQGPCGVLAL